MRQRLLGLTGIWVLSLCFTAPAWGADNPLAAFPSDVSVLIQLKNPNATIEKAAAFADAIQPGSGNQVRFGGQAIGAMISNPTRDGVDNDADWWVGVFVSQGSEPSLMFAIPASDHGLMSEALGEDVTYVKYEKWGVYCDEEEIGEKIKSLVNGKGKSIESLVTKESQGVLSRGDLAVFLNLQQLRKSYQPQLEQFQEQFEQGLDAFKANGPQQGPQAVAALKPVITMLKSVVSAVDDLESCTLGLGIGKTDIQFEDLLTLTADSPTSKFLGTPPGSDMALLKKLPAGNLLYFGMNADNQWIVKWGMQVVRDMVSDPALAAKFDEVTKKHTQLKYGAIVGAMGVGTPETGALRSVGLSEVDQPTKLQELYTQLMELMSQVQLGPENVHISYDLKKGAEKYGKNSADVLITKQEIEGDDVASDFQDQIFEALYGPEGAVTRLVYTDDHVIQTMGGGKAAMFAALEAESANPPVANPALEAARKAHGDKVSAIAFVDLAGIMTNVARFLNNSGVVPPNSIPGELLELEAKPSFVGMSLNLESAAVRVKTVIPVEQIQKIAEFAIKAQTVQTEEF